MAVDRNVTWKEYNGTDYNNLYPKTKDSNVLLSPESKEKLGISKDGASVSDAFFQKAAVTWQVNIPTV